MLYVVLDQLECNRNSELFLFVIEWNSYYFIWFMLWSFKLYNWTKSCI